MNLKQLLTNMNPFKKGLAEIKVSQDIISELPEEPKIIEKIKNKVGKPIGVQDEIKIEAVTMFGHGWTTCEIADFIEENYNINMTYQNINNYIKTEKWKPYLKKAQSERETKVTNAAGRYKAVRIERAERVYDRAVKKGDLKYSLAAIEQQRKEYEKYEEGMMNILRDQYANMSDEEVKERKNQVLIRLKENKNGSSGVQGEAGK